MKPLAQIVEAIQADLLSLHQLLDQLTDLQYSQSLEILSGSSIGQHFRHILEFYSCSLSAVTCGKLCYDERDRDNLLENDPSTALQLCNQIIRTLYFVDLTMADIQVMLKTQLLEGEESMHINSSLAREFLYCLEHSIHHQALIKIGLRQLNLLSLVDQNFGTAPSTVRYQSREKYNSGY